MDLRIENQRDLIVLRVAGDLSSFVCKELEDAVTSALEDRPSKIVLDIEKVEFAGSAALRVFLTLAKKGRSESIAVVIVAPTPEVAEVFQITGLEKYLTIVSSTEEATGSAV